MRSLPSAAIRSFCTCFTPDAVGTTVSVLMYFGPLKPYCNDVERCGCDGIMAESSPRYWLCLRLDPASIFPGRWG
jgi:hypothetical protein